MHKLLVLLLLIQLALAKELKLKQVVILSRHNLRTPLSSTLSQFTSKPWPQWKEKAGDLTAKGAVLEGFMGEYFSLWMKQEGLLTDSCPNEHIVYAYANNKQRTKASAEAFVKTAFPDCNVIVHYADKKKIDPTFHPAIHNPTKKFIDAAEIIMKDRLKEIDVTSSFMELQNVLEYSKSKNCLLNKLCDLTKDESSVDDIAVNEEPGVSGPLHIGNTVVDAFKMEYYEGFPMEQVAWDQITKPEQWSNLMLINRAYHDVRFNTTLIAKDIARPLILFIRDTFASNTDEPKLTLLMGHDANILTVLRALKIKPYVLHEQYENTPIGGKLVFQKWRDENDNRDFLKIEYVYQSSSQLRDEIKLDLNYPPHRVVLGLEQCPIDENGFCDWTFFMDILNEFSDLVDFEPIISVRTI